MRRREFLSKLLSIAFVPSAAGLLLPKERIWMPTDEELIMEYTAWCGGWINDGESPGDGWKLSDENAKIWVKTWYTPAGNEVKRLMGIDPTG